MTPNSVFCVLLLAAVLLGCGRQPEPRHIVILPDVSGSIDRKSLDEAFKAIDDLIGHLHRGDRIAIIPILGDAQAEASGRIIRFEVPTNRQAYDSDLHRFRVKLKVSLKEMEATAVAHPGSKTDIFGSITLAEQEFQVAPNLSKRTLVILSDFIQEDTEIDFRWDRRLGNKVAAEKFAAQFAKRKAFAFKKTKTYLGLLRSTEYTGLRQIRREAIQEFWVRYLAFVGAQPRFVTDGSGLLSSI